MTAPTAYRRPLGTTDKKGRRCCPCGSSRGDVAKSTSSARARICATRRSAYRARRRSSLALPVGRIRRTAAITALRPAGHACRSATDGWRLAARSIDTISLLVRGVTPPANAARLPVQPRGRRARAQQWDRRRDGLQLDVTRWRERGGAGRARRLLTVGGRAYTVRSRPTRGCADAVVLASPVVSAETQPCVVPCGHEGLRSRGARVRTGGRCVVTGLRRRRVVISLWRRGVLLDGARAARRWRGFPLQSRVSRRSGSLLLDGDVSRVTTAAGVCRPRHRGRGRGLRRLLLRPDGTVVARSAPTTSWAGARLRVGAGDGCAGVHGARAGLALPTRSRAAALAASCGDRGRWMETLRSCSPSRSRDRR